MPLLTSIKEENEQIKAERVKIENDMKLLDKLTKDLYNENTALRNHYNQRTFDLNKITKTIAINAKE